MKGERLILFVPINLWLKYENFATAASVGEAAAALFLDIPRLITSPGLPPIGDIEKENRSPSKTNNASPFLHIRNIE